MQPLVISRTNHSVSRKDIDNDALKVLYRLYRAGHTVFLVGGGVRDLILGRKPKDFDIATSARPSQIKRLFRNCRLVGRRFRLAHICFGIDKIMEVSTFRREPDLEDGDRESEQDSASELYIRSDNTFGTPEEDALRRDFTINSIFYDISTYSLLDYVGGVEDLRKGIIRTIGDPNERFCEDPVRMIRAIKFCARLGFKMDRATWEGIVNNHQAIEQASVPRVQEEIMRILESKSAARCFELLDDSGLLEDLIPELFRYLAENQSADGQNDPGGHMLIALMHQLDSIDQPVARPLLYLTAILPLMLQAHLMDSEADDSEIRVLIKDMAGRFGICRKSQEHCLQIISHLRRMLPRRGGNSSFPRNFVGRSVFAEAFMLLKIMHSVGLVSAEDVELWAKRKTAHERKAAAQAVQTPVARTTEPVRAERSEHRYHRRRSSSAPR